MRYVFAVLVAAVLSIASASIILAQTRLPFGTQTPAKTPTRQGYGLYDFVLEGRHVCVYVFTSPTGGVGVWQSPAVLPEEVECPELVAR